MCREVIKTSYMKKLLYVLGALLVAVLFQGMFFLVDYDKIMQTYSRVVEEFETISCTYNDRVYTVTGDDPHILIENGGKATGTILIDLQKASKYDVPIQIFYAKEHGVYTEEDSVINQLSAGATRTIISIPDGEYASIRIDIDLELNRSWLIEEIRIREMNITTLELIVSKVSWFGTLVVMSMVCYVMYLSRKKDFWYTYAPYILVVVVGFISFIKMPSFSDDVFLFPHVLESTTWVAYWKERYETWSSRNIIESILIHVLGTPYLWALISAFLMVLLCYATTRIVEYRTKWKYWISLLLIGIFPMYILGGAGWITTTVNYLWVLSLGVFACIPIVKYFRSEIVSLKEWIVYGLALVYASNQEQMAAILFGVYLLASIYTFVQHVYSKMVYLVTIMLGGTLVYHLTAPGNAVRKVQEMNDYFPEFSELSRMKQLEMGFSLTIKNYFMYPNALCFIFTLGIAFVVYANYKSEVKRCIATIPLLVCILFGIEPSFITWMFLVTTDLSDGITEYGVDMSVTNINTIIPFLFLVAILCFIMWALKIIYQDWKRVMMMWVIFWAGFCSSVVIGLSPTIVKYAPRTYTFMNMAIIILIGFLYKEMWERGNKVQIRIMTYVMAASGCLIWLKMLMI